ncbi:ferritin [Skermanella stibiiresistens SB22]|uniref:Ferritin n=2 Tax=Skermanella TaxID=204447 RepID=W9H0Q4_9PROT|nr:ferritin [Skermanella stibiiresistens SB22]
MIARIAEMTEANIHRIFPQSLVSQTAISFSTGDGRDVALIAELNDLLQLDHDAVGAYTLAIAALRDPGSRDRLIQFREDHERHIADLTALIQARDGVPINLPHFPTGLMKMMVQAGGSAGGLAGGDRSVLMAFVANETQARDKYRRHADAGHPSDVAAVLERGASDEEAHLEWAWDALDRLGIGRGTIPGNVTDAIAFVHGANADLIEAGGRLWLDFLARTLRTL